MKKFLIVALFIFSAYLFIGCTTVPLTMDDVPNKFSLPQEEMNWVHTNIRYVSHTSYLEDAQSPEDTLACGTGNCVDMAVLLLYLVKRDECMTGYIVDIMPIDFNLTHGVGHFIVYLDFDNSYYDPVTNICSKSIYEGWYRYKDYKDYQ
jgi:hypothetical protein